MKKLIIILVFISSVIYSQKIGDIIEEKPQVIFPTNSWGIDIMIGEGGFGLGTFFRKAFTQNFYGFVDFSISESKDEREIQYWDYWGNVYTFGKKNRVFLMPVNFGIQYRLFSNDLTESLRPFVCVGAGPHFILTTPYDKEFFNSFGYAQMKYAVGGYIGFGANFGSSTSTLVGLTFKYFYLHVLGDGVENLYNKFRKNISHFYLTLNLGLMY
ncbi:MAG: hypothetical protein JXA68_09755 [Ignavibacteriales bacterium]|nr:hypothetical protein [Ignavibacteriales bacterium]